MIRLKNNTGGYYSIKLSDYTGARPDKIFSFPLPTTILPVHKDYIMSIPSDVYAYEAYKKGLFIVVEGEEEFNKILKESGFFTEEEIDATQKSIVHDNLLISALINGSLEKVKEYANSSNKLRLIQLAIDNKDKISQEKIKYIEKIAGISLSDD